MRLLQTKFVGPFEVIKKDSAVNYRLLLPDYMKRTNLFHISQLRKRNSIPDALIVAPVNPMTSNEFASSSKLNSVVEILDYKKVAKGYNLKARLRDGTEFSFEELANSSEIMGFTGATINASGIEFRFLNCEMWKRFVLFM